MKRIFSILMLAAVFGFAACEQTEKSGEPGSIKRTPAINVTNEKLDPATDESGTVRAYVGTEVTAKGINLDHVGLVKVDGKEAEIVKKEMKTLVFVIPDIGKPQQDDPYMVSLEVFEEETEALIFKYDYFVTIPVTDALVSGFDPKAGTVGTEVTVSGRNLEQITSVSFGGVAVAADKFVSQEGAKVVVAVPAVSVTGADTELDVAAVWAGGTIPMTDKFTLSVPVFSSYTQATPALLGDEVVLAGSNLNLVDAVKWGDDALLISEQSATSITVKVPSGLDKQDPAVVSKALTALYGTPAQTITILAAFQVDTTPIGPAAPVFSSVAPTDVNYDKIFLGREVTVKGENFASIEKFKIDGNEVALSEAATDISAKFVVPRTITGTAKKSVSLVAVWNDGNEADFGTIEVYPFYYTKGLRIGIGSNSKNTYPEFNRENAFVLLDEGRVVSVTDFKTLNVDPFALSGTNSVVTSANTAAVGKETEYYSVQPYLFAISNSSNKLTFVNPANTANQLKCHFDADKNPLPTTFGTPVMFMVVVADADLKAAVSGGTLSDIATTVDKAGTSAPAFGTSEGSTWVKGSVIGLQYVTYDYASKAKKPEDGLVGVRKVGYIVVKDITCGDPSTGLALASREGYIDLDLYWSNVLE